jgi:predicted RNA-binding Zn ribbon-like protein
MDFIFLGNHIATDFVNTEAIAQQSRIDLIETPELFSSWLAATKIADNLTCSDEGLREAKNLRTNIRDCFDSLIQAHAISSHNLSQLNSLSNRLKTYLEGQDNLYIMSNQINSAEDACAYIAQATCELIASPQRTSLRKCASDQCILYFIDVSKNQQRQWCSMELCGNRKKAQKHYQKSKKP